MSALHPPKSRISSFPSQLWGKMRAKLRAKIYGSAAYMTFLRGTVPSTLNGTPQLLLPGTPDLARQMLKGEFKFAGKVRKVDDLPWSVMSEDQQWQTWIHGFSWLKDLMSLNEAQAKQSAIALIEKWNLAHGVWSEFAWRGDVMGERLIHWIAAHKTLLAEGGEEFRPIFLRSLTLQARHLCRSNHSDLQSTQLLRAQRSAIICALFVPGLEGQVDRLLHRFGAEIDLQILPDGLHISRSPQLQLDVLTLLVELVEVLRAQQKEFPQSLLRAIDRMVPMIRALCLGDGSMSLFHGAGESHPALISAIIDKAGGRGKAMANATHGGFQRLEAGDSIIVMDCGAPPRPDLNPDGHAGTLSFEFSSGPDRLIVNCGTGFGQEETWSKALAASAAHSTLVVDEHNSSEILTSGGVDAGLMTLEVKRVEDGGQIYVEASHDGYREDFGLIHRRSLYLDKTGGDLRGEDRLIGSGGAAFAIHFHLHPDVHASRLQDGALLKLPNGSGWHLKVRGAEVSLQESIYMGRPGQLRHSERLTLSGPLRGEGAEIKWRLSRIRN